MKNNNFKTLRFSISKSKFDSTRLADLTFRNGGRPMMNHLLRVIPLLGGTLSRNWAKTCLTFLKKLNLLYQHQGLKGVVKHLKTATVCLQQVSAGYTIRDLTPLGVRVSRSKTGLPRIIPADHRKMIMQGDKVVLRFWLTVLSLYRDFHFVGDLKLKTITAPSSASSRAVEVNRFIKSFVTLYYRDHDRSFSTQHSIFQMLKSGPQASRAEGEFNSHPVSVLRSLINLLSPQHKDLYHSLDQILDLTNNMLVLGFKANLIKTFRHKLNRYGYKVKSSFLGRLAIKEEAAGKVRVFAMVDPWTQWALKPLHKKLFNVLSRIPTDGTFNQLKPLLRVPFGRVPIYSFDLSAATDRLPLSLQKEILSVAYSPEFAHHWAVLMVGRDFKTPSAAELSPISVPDSYPKSVRYAVGQPMGALSSWAMLAMTHHYIVHYAAWISSSVPHGKPFSEYAVLGDDIVIWNRRTARAYVNVMKTLGVEIGLAKSIISDKGKGLEFAKKTIIEGVDVSPIPFAEQSSAHRSMANMISFTRKYKLSALQVLRFLGYGYKVDPTKSNRVVNAFNTALAIPSTYRELLDLFSKQYGYMDWKLTTSYPPAYMKRAIVTFTSKEAGQILQQVKTLKKSLFALDCASFVKVLGPGRDVEQVIRSEIITEVAPRYILILDAHERALKGYLSLTSDIISFYKGIYFDIPFTTRQKLDPYPADFSCLVNELFKARASLDEIQLDLLISPAPGIPKSPTFVEEQRTLRLWNRWSKTLLKVGTTQSFSNQNI